MDERVSHTVTKFLKTLDFRRSRQDLRSLTLHWLNKKVKNMQMMRIYLTTTSRVWSTSQDLLPTTPRAKHYFSLFSQKPTMILIAKAKTNCLIQACRKKLKQSALCYSTNRWRRKMMMMVCLHLTSSKESSACSSTTETCLGKQVQIYKWLTFREVQTKRSRSNQKMKKNFTDHHHHHPFCHIMYSIILICKEIKLINQNVTC